MVLDSQRRQTGVCQPLDRSVIEVNVGHKNVLRQSGRVDRVAVVLGSHVDISRLDVFYRLVTTPMPELQLEGRRAQSPCDYLVSKTDAHHRRR